MTKRTRPRIRLTFWIRLILGVVLLAVILNLVPPDEIIDAIASANPLPMLAASSLIVLNLGFQIQKWKYMLALLGISVPRKRLIASFFFGMTLGSFTPGQIGEYGGRAVHLSSEVRGSVIGLAVIDKLQVFGIMSIGGITALLALSSSPSAFIVLGAFLLCLCILFCLFRFSAVRRFLLSVGIQKLRYPWVLQAVDSLVLFKPRDIAVTTMLTILFYSTVYCQLFLLLTSFQPLDPIDAFLGYGAMMFSKSILPFSIADLGVRELGLVYFMSLLGYPRAGALTASLILFVVNIIIPALIGLLFIPKSISGEAD